MQKRTLGHSNIQVAPLVLGGNVFGWTIDAEKSFAILDAFVDHGFNFIDTADVYSRWVPGHHGGESETILGQWLKKSGKREKVILATKAGIDMGDNKKGLSKRYILEAAEASLQRLQTDHIDLYQSHQDDESTPLEETLEAYQQLIQQGKVRIIGASNYKGNRLTKAIDTAQQHNLPVYQTLQPEYNLHARQDYETDLAPVAKKFGLGVIPYYSLASGFLTGKYKTKEEASGANREKMVEKYFDGRGEKILKTLDEVSRQANSKPASVALAWLLAQPTITAPIASATSIEQLEDLFAAVDLKLDAAALEKLNQASAY
jgi:aryl-alcohol dehydrogenase-like predicted oxidoreductase